jgi:hypothetical protein
LGLLTTDHAVPFNCSVSVPAAAESEPTAMQLVLVVHETPLSVPATLATAAPRGAAVAPAAGDAHSTAAASASTAGMPSVHMTLRHRFIRPDRPGRARPEILGMTNATTPPTSSPTTRAS